MKKSLVLTSLLALAACGGGSGGSGGGSVGGNPAAPTPVVPVVTIQGFSGGTTVNTNNTELTNMSSYTVDYGTDENTTKQKMIDYVNARLGASRGLLTSAMRSASAPKAQGMRVDDTAFANADAALTQMKQVVYDMVHKSEQGTDALTDYVVQYKDAIIQALRLADQQVPDDASVAQLVTLFNVFKTASGITSENLVAKMNEFDLNNFEITKYALDGVRLKDTGEEGFFKFKLNDTGAIESVALLEDPISEYGSSWPNTRIIMDAAGDAVAAESDPIWGLNPFNTDYLTDKAGTLVRNGTEFSNTVKFYEFDLGEYNQGEGHLVLDSGNSTSAILSPDDFKKIELTSEEALNADTAKAKLKEYIISKVNNKIHNQHGEPGTYDLADALQVVNWYFDKIDSTVTNDAAITSQGDIHQVAAMHGMGKDDGVKLKYSDFGYTSLTRTMDNNQETNYLTYVGGYDARRMDNAVVNGDLDGATFTGTAVVTVEDHHKDTSGATKIETTKAALYKDTTAVLQYDIVGGKAKHTLTMDSLKAIDGDVTQGSDWYTMVVSGTEGAVNVAGNPEMKVSFNAAGKNIDADYQFFKANNDGTITRNENLSVADQVVKTDGTEFAIDMTDGTGLGGDYRAQGAASAEYYGQDTANPTEAPAGVWMDERWHNGAADNIKHELSVYGAFGGQKD